MPTRLVTSGLWPCGRPVSEWHGGARGAPGARRRPHDQVRGLRAPERAARDHRGGPSPAARRREPLVSRRARQRGARAHGLRAPVRAHDVPGLEARAGQRAHRDARGRRRERSQRHDGLRPHELLRDRAVESARARAVARVGSHGLPARPAHRVESREPAGRRPQRAASERRERAVRHRRRGRVPRPVPEGPSVLRRSDWLARRHPGREARRRARVLPSVLRARTTPASPSSATSIPRRRRRSSRSTSAR